MNDSPAPVRVVVVDDHPVFRAGLRTLLATCVDVAFVGEADSGEAALDLVAAQLPDVVLMDLHMTGIGGVEACRRLAETHPATRVLVLTMSRDDDTVLAAVRAGAHGFLLKGADGEEILAAVTAVARGGAVFGGGAAPAALQALRTAPGAVAFPELSDREREVLSLLAAGLANGLIARELHLSVKTVQNHVSAVLGKLGVRDRTAAALAAQQAGVVGKTSRSR